MLQSDPNIVRSVKPSDFSLIPVQDQDECMMLHGPRIMKIKKEELTYYDIIVHSEKNTAFSLCRFKDKEEAQKRFNQYKSYIPIILAIDRELFIVSTLQNICDTLRQYPSYSIGFYTKTVYYSSQLTPILDPRIPAIPW